jgi:hypothetical protein
MSTKSISSKRQVKTKTNMIENKKDETNRKKRHLEHTTSSKPKANNSKHSVEPNKPKLNKKEKETPKPKTTTKRKIEQQQQQQRDDEEEEENDNINKLEEELKSTRVELQKQIDILNKLEQKVQHGGHTHQPKKKQKKNTSSDRLIVSGLEQSDIITVPNMTELKKYIEESIPSKYQPRKDYVNRVIQLSTSMFMSQLNDSKDIIKSF